MAEIGLEIVDRKHPIWTTSTPSGTSMIDLHALTILAKKDWGTTQAYPLLSVLLSSLLLCSGCAALKNMSFVGGGADYWRADLDGEIQLTDDLITGTVIDVVDTLDLDRRDESVVYRASIALGNVLVEDRFFEIDYDGNTELTQQIEF